MEDPKPNKKSRLSEEDQRLKERLMKRKPGDIRPGRPVSEEFWNMPRAKIRGASLLEALLKDREEGR